MPLASTRGPDGGRPLAPIPGGEAAACSARGSGGVEANFGLAGTTAPAIPELPAVRTTETTNGLTLAGAHATSDIESAPIEASHELLVSATPSDAAHRETASERNLGKVLTFSMYGTRPGQESIARPRIASSSAPRSGHG